MSARDDACGPPDPRATAGAHGRAAAPPIGDARSLAAAGRRIVEVALAPDGRAALLVTCARDPVADKDAWELWTWSGGAVERVAAGGDAVRRARWLPGADAIAVVRGGAGRTSVAVVGLSGAPVELLQLEGAVADLDVAPAGDRIAVAARVPRPARPAVVLEPSGVRRVTAPGYKYDGEGLRDGSTVQVLVVDVASGAVRVLPGDPVDVETLRWSPDGRWIAVVRRGGDPYAPDARLLPADGSGLPLVLGAGLCAVKALAWHPDSTRVAALAAARLADYDAPDLVTIDVPNGDWRTLVDGAAVEWTPTAELAWEESGTVLAGGIYRGAVDLYRVDADGGWERLPLAPAWRHSLTAAGGRAAWVEQTPFERGEVATADGERTSLNGTVEGLVHEPFTVAGEAGPVDAFLTRRSGTGSHPAVFVVHGGPAAAVGWDCDELTLLLAARGFAVVRHNPRGSYGRGRAFQQAVQGDYGGGEYRDLLAVVAAVAERADVDAGRLAICGHSHGGYMAAWALARGNQFRAGVAEAPVFDLRSIWGTSDAGPRWGELVHGGPPWRNPEYFADRSPSTHAHHTTAPTLILGAEGDRRCPLGQAEQMFAHLHAAGCPVELAIYPGADHGTATTPALHADKLERIARWLETHLTSA